MFFARCFMLIGLCIAAIHCNDEKLSRNWATAEVEPKFIDFGETYVGLAVEKSFTVTNNGNRSIRLTNIEVQGTDEFKYAASLLDLLSADGSILLTAKETKEFEIVYLPVDFGSDEAVILIETDDVEVGGGTVELKGNSIVDEPPVAVWQDPVSPQTRTEIVLNGSDSYDLEGSTLRYQWELTTPNGSQAVLFWPGNVESSFFADISGSYSVSLTVFDFLNQASETVTRVVEVGSYQAIRIELSWDQPDVDLDLHLIRDPGDLWGIDDVFWANPAPNWNQNSNPNDDPYLELDDRDGYGPEVIGALNPDGGMLRLAVHAYYMPVGITAQFWVRVYFTGILVGDYGPIVVNSNYELFNVANFSFPNFIEETVGESMIEIPPGL